MSNQMVTANTLTDGAVVYMTADDGWTEDVNQGQWAADDEAKALLERAQKSVDSCVVVGTYLIDIEVSGETIRPVRFRERVRANGPTIKQTGSA